MKTHRTNPTHPTSRRPSPRGYERYLRGRGCFPTFEERFAAEEKRRASELDDDGAPPSVTSFIERSLEQYH